MAAKRKTVWVVERGEYSDYRVEGVYSTRENAERIAAAFNGSGSWRDATVAEWEMDPGIDRLGKNLRSFSITMLRDGTVESVDERDRAWVNITDDSTFHIWRRTQAPAYRDKPGVVDALRADVWARNEKHAVKIANEKRAQMIASGEWVA